MKKSIKDQPAPKENEHPPIWPMVIESLGGLLPEEETKQVIKDMKDRDAIGLERYGTRLQPFNDRDALTDAYQECLDGVVYFGQYIFEKGKSANPVILKIYNDMLLSLSKIRKAIDNNNVSDNKTASSG